MVWLPPLLVCDQAAASWPHRAVKHRTTTRASGPGSHLRGICGYIAPSIRRRRGGHGTHGYGKKVHEGSGTSRQEVASSRRGGQGLHEEGRGSVEDGFAGEDRGARERRRSQRRAHT